MPERILLGPQRPHTNLPEAFRDRGLPGGPVAVISAGWQEAEGDIDDVRALVPRELIDLELYRRAEELFRQVEASINPQKDNLGISHAHLIEAVQRISAHPDRYIDPSDEPVVVLADFQLELR